MVWKRRADELLYESKLGKYCQGWSPDGKSLLFMTVSHANRDMWTLPLIGDRKPIPYLQTEFSEAGGRYSPDGKWVVYYSDESRNNEVYVRSLLPTGAKLLVSPSGGSRPKWCPDGKEILYLSATGELMAAVLKHNRSLLEVGVAKLLFQTHRDSFLRSYDVTPDGQRILVVSSLAEKLPSPITVIVNWDTGLKRQ